jgi:hypothetical protein
MDSNANKIRKFFYLARKGLLLGLIFCLCQSSTQNEKLELMASIQFITHLICVQSVKNGDSVSCLLPCTKASIISNPTRTATKKKNLSQIGFLIRMADPTTTSFTNLWLLWLGIGLNACLTTWGFPVLISVGAMVWCWLVWLLQTVDVEVLFSSFFFGVVDIFFREVRCDQK